MNSIVAGDPQKKADLKQCTDSSKHRNGHKKRRGRASISDNAEKIVVAVNGAKEITKYALEWALTHVVQPGDSITLLAVIVGNTTGRKMWAFPRLAGDCASGYKKQNSGCCSQELRNEINNSCSQMMLQLNDVCDSKKVNVKVKVVSSALPGAAAAEAKRARATWVVLDKKLKKEEKSCMEELHCNLVIIKHSKPKILRLNLVGSPRIEDCSPSFVGVLKVEDQITGKISGKSGDSVHGETAAPSSSPELGTPFTTTEIATSSTSSSEPGASPFMVTEPALGSNILKSVETIMKEPICDEETTDSGDAVAISDSDSDDSVSLSTNLDFLAQHWMDAKPHPVYRNPLAAEVRKSALQQTSISRAGLLSYPYLSSSALEQFSSTRQHSSKWREENTIKNPAANLDMNEHNSKIETAKTLLQRFSELDREAGISKQDCEEDLDRTSSVRKAMSLSRNAPPGPPPLCSICQHKAPVFGKPPKWFSFSELQRATDGFSQANFLAEGGFGSVHRGILPDGQAVAVKQHKLASSQGDLEFCSEVEVLSCAQHRNVVMLIGYCIEDKRRLLVYEYVCNGSLDSHLYGRGRETLEWIARQKIAIGAARGLRYLHEECRVGCIVHRDMRPNNILLTHDFEPMVGDFGLARWQPDGDLAVETRVIGTFGYLAPEYAQSGQITEKADVYSFGVVLIELVTGRKAVDINRPRGEQCLTEWARPLLEEHAIHELVDPRLGNRYSEYEVYCMLHAACLCIRRDPHQRPRMSQVLRILEGDVVIDSSCAATPLYDNFSLGSRSGRMSSEHLMNRIGVPSSPAINHSGTLAGYILADFSGKLSLNGDPPVNYGKPSYETIKAAYRERDKLQGFSYGE